MSQSVKITLLRAKLAGPNHVLDIVAWLASEQAMAGCLSVSQVVGSAVTARARFKSHALFCCGAGCGISPGGSA